MLKIFLTQGKELIEIPNFQQGCWIHVINPDAKEIERLIEMTGIDEDFVAQALDSEERAHIEINREQKMLIIDTPIPGDPEDRTYYITVPLGIVMTNSYLLTICLEEDTMMRKFSMNRVEGFKTQYQTRFILQILMKNATQYLYYLRVLDRIQQQTENYIYKNMRNKELLQLLKIEKSLVYFRTALTSNEIVFQRLRRAGGGLTHYPENMEIMEDVLIETQQAMEMTTVYLSILGTTMDTFSSIISNNMNSVMKVLTSMTVVLSIPTIIGGIWGMNVALPFEKDPQAFWILIFITTVVSGLVIWWLKRREML